MDHLRRAALKLALGEQPTEDLPVIAAQALAGGLESPALVELAGLSRRDPPADIRDLFVQTMAELGFPVPGVEEAWRERMLGAAEDMLTGSLTHYEAGHEIYWCACHLERTDASTKLVGLFVGLWSSWEDWPDERASIERDMRLAAADLLRSHGKQVPE
ncbi:hypothetical protein [Streptomyces sp. TLI_105]|uniref:hypothetical protein n=1 Tax=Streptomyces sp. TLI_105 TaxID=1881019 RepID=UPI00089A098D|nr:hypothetical protein [Streptomyces sp. TLI_105]SEC49533.1 hypothetical protein SAMN05428939_2517 [Streptomyces sp. TLI_105]